MIRRARVRALAKINLDLRVLHRRPDGYHEIRTIFQTISLGDALELEVTRAKRTEVTLVSSVDIPDNLVARAARLCLEEMKVHAGVRMRLRKSVPMGAGLGGGSSDAAAVLLTLPALLGKPLSLERRISLGRTLGSDVPFFLLGGTAVGLGRGTEVYPLPDFGKRAAVIVAPGIHVSTPAAYRALGRPGADDELTTIGAQNTIEEFQSLTWSPGFPHGQNDFEEPVFAEHASLRAWKRRLLKSGAEFAMLSGSGSSLFGIFGTNAQAHSAARSLRGADVFSVSLVTRRRYQSSWRKWLGDVATETLWPPQGRLGQ
ncbi:MAG: 4-(cytidine 5'-diphospho)-2-C-methyl-D-erythritol kinase [Bryobacteraceae bacterium]